MSFSQNKFTNFISAKRLPTNIYQTQQSFCKLKAPAQEPLAVYSPSSSEKPLQEYLQKPSSTNWRYVELRKTHTMKYVKFFIIFSFYMVPKAIKSINQKRFPQEILSKEDPRNTSIGASAYQDKLE